MKVLFIWPNKDDPFFRPINISLLSALLRRSGHKTECFDTSFIDFGFSSTSGTQTESGVFKPIDWSSYDIGKRRVNLTELFIQKLEFFRPDVLAVSVLSDEINVAKDICKIAKDWDSRLTTIWGGKGATTDVEGVLSFKSVDFVCRGEGIVAFPKFIDSLERGEEVHDAWNLCYRQGSSIIKNDLCPLFDDFDSLPFLDWSIYDKRLFFKPFEGRVYRGGDHMISWGCPNNCSYCINDFYHRMYGGFKPQRYSTKRIINELVELTRTYNIELYKFHDEDFLLKPSDYFAELVDLYVRKVNVPFVCMTNPKTVTEERVRLLKDMGCVAVSLGIETGDMELRKNILMRRDTREDIIRAFKLLNNAKIRTNAFNMLGIPFETRETIMKTVMLNKEANVQNPQVGFFFPFKETKLREIAIKNGFYDPNNERVYDPERPALHFNNISEEELMILWKRFPWYVKLPMELWPFIERSENLDKTGRALEKKLYEIYKECVLDHDRWFNDNGKIGYYLSELKRIIRET